MTKRIISFLLMVLMLLSFTGCVDGNESGNDATASNESGVSIDTNQYINEDGTITVPDLINMPLEQARAILKQLGLKSKFTEEYDKTDKFEVGCVMKTDYKAGEKVKRELRYFLPSVRKEHLLILTSLIQIRLLPQEKSLSKARIVTISPSTMKR